MTVTNITKLRWRYEILVREKVRIQEELDDIRDQLAEVGVEP